MEEGRSAGLEIVHSETPKEFEGYDTTWHVAYEDGFCGYNKQALITLTNYAAYLDGYNKGKLDRAARTNQVAGKCKVCGREIRAGEVLIPVLPFGHKCEGCRDGGN